MSLAIRTFTELKRYKTFDERFDYLSLQGTVAQVTFGFDRYLNQKFYGSKLWKRARDEVIVRDNGCNLGVKGYEIYGRIVVHHMNPITIEDVENVSEYLFNPLYLICTDYDTHLAIHYGDAALLPKTPIIRRPGDTSPWLNT